MTKFRQHCGSLEESLKTVQDITKQDLVNQLNEELRDCNIVLSVDDIKDHKYVYDKRCNWDTHIITAEHPKFKGVLGMSDGELK